MYYIVRWLFVLFVNYGDCEIRGVVSHQRDFTTKAKADSFALTLNTTKTNTSYGDYIDSVKVWEWYEIPDEQVTARIDTVCKQ